MTTTTTTKPLAPTLKVRTLKKKKSCYTAIIGEKKQQRITQRIIILNPSKMPRQIFRQFIERDYFKMKSCVFTK